MTSDPWTRQAGTFSAAERLAGWDRAACAASRFRRHGYAQLHAVPANRARALGDWVRSLPNNPEGPLKHATTEALLESAELREIATAPDAWREAALWLGAEPRIIDVGAWVSEPGDQIALAQGWHRDMDDWRACKQFVFLSDVGDDQGPHEFVPGSHREEFYENMEMAPEQWLWGSGRTLDHRLVESWPRLIVKGPAGTRWVENTYGWHRGCPVREGTRVILSVCYGLVEYAHMREKMNMIKERWKL